MAEGGMAAALAHNDDRDNWKVHFADTMRGGQYVNNWRMAELHAKEAPDRVRELEAWGAVFDRTPDGRINQRNFGGHRYPRLAHVGDRTGPRADSHAAGPHRPSRRRRPHGAHRHRACCWTTAACRASLGYDRERGRFHVFSAKAVVLATGGVGRAYKITSNSWEGTGDGHALAYRAGAELIDMEFIQFHPTGMVWPPSVKGILVTEGVRGEGGVLKNSEGRRFMFDDIPDNYKPQTADGCGRGLALHAGRQERAASARAADARPRRALHHARGQGRPRQPARRRVPRHRVDQGEAAGSAEHIKRKLPSMYHQFKELADLDITKEPMEVGPTTHYIMGGIRVDADTQMSTIPGLFAAGECAAGHQRRQPPRRQLAVRPDRVRQARRRVRGGVRAGSTAPVEARRAADRARDQTSRWRRSSAARAARTPSRCRTTCRTRCRAWSASSGTRPRCSEALTRARRRSRSAPRASASPATANTTPAGTPRSICRTC